MVQYFPFVFLLTSAALRSVDQSVEDAALSLGSPPRRTFRTAILPIIAPSLTAGALLTFMATMADFGTPMIIGEGLHTLPTLMYGEFINELGGNPAMASTLGSLLILVNTAALMAQRYYAFRKAYNVVCIQPLTVRRTPARRRLALTVFAYGVVCVALIPSTTILISSFMPTRGPVMYAGFSLQSYQTIFHVIPRAITNTFFLTALAVVLDVLLGVLVAYLLARRRSRVHALLDALIMLAYAIMVALFHREKTGIGQEINVAMLGTMIWVQTNNILYSLLAGKPRERQLRRQAKNPLVNHYRCRDNRWILLAHFQPDRYWPPFCRALGLTDLQDDPRFKTLKAREENCAELVTIIDEAFAGNTRDEWLAILAAHDLIYSPIKDYWEVVNDPQVLENEFLTSYNHPALGEIKEIGIPVELSKTPGSIREPAPQLGQHTEEVLIDKLGYSWEDIEKLRDGGVIL